MRTNQWRFYGRLFRVACVSAGLLVGAVGSIARADTLPQALKKCNDVVALVPQYNQYCVGNGWGAVSCKAHPAAGGFGGTVNAECGNGHPQGQSFYYIACPIGTIDHTRTAVPVQGNPADEPPACKEGCEVKVNPSSCTKSIMIDAVRGVQCLWKTTGQNCPTNEPDPDEEDKCLKVNGKKVCERPDRPKYCASVEGGEQICVDGDDTDPPCTTGSTAAACKNDTSPPDPPIEHEPPYNPNPPPPNFEFTINNNNNYQFYTNNPPPPNQPPDPPPTTACGTAGNAPCETPSDCGQPNKPPCDNEGDGPDGDECGGEGEPVCNDDGEPACGRPGKPACNNNGTPSCGTSTTPPCGTDGGPSCGIPGKPQCGWQPPGGNPPGSGYTGPTCGVAGKPACVGGNTGSCGSAGQPPCSTCGGVGQPPCGSCGAVGQPQCGQCGGQGEPECDDGQASGGGSCGAPPSCSGDAVNCAVLYQTYMTRCAVEDFHNYSDRQTDFGRDFAASDAVEPEGDGVDPMSMLDGAGWLGGGSCSLPTSITLLEHVYALDEDGALCNALSIAGVLVLLFAYVQAARVMFGGP